MTLAMMVMICPTIVSQTSNSSSSGSRWARGEPKKRKIILIRPGEIDPYGGAIPISNGIVLWKDEEDDEYGEVGEMQCSTVCNARFQQIRILFLLHPQHQQSGCWHEINTWPISNLLETAPWVKILSVAKVLRHPVCSLKTDGFV